MNVGIMFGCFIPLHKGHLKLIEKAIQENDKVIIGVCGYDDDRGQNFIPFKTRYKLMKRKYANNPNIKVVKIDDKKLGLTGTFSLEAWRIWCDELFGNAKISPSNNCKWYTGDPPYAEKLKELYPKHEMYLSNRQEDNISGTMIRQDYRKYKNLIDEDFYEYLEGNVK